MLHEEDEDYIHQHQAQNANMMDQFGSDLAADPNVAVGGLACHHHSTPDEIAKRKAEQRIKRGECPSCRRKTHKVTRNLLPFGTTKREPLTVEGEVVNGHCLRCKPLEGYMRIPPQKRRSARPAIPETLEVPLSRSGTEFEVNDDDMTVASEITMDPYLTATDPGINPNYRGSGQSSGRYRSNSATGRPHLMESHFESVSEETPMNDFGRHAEKHMNDFGRHAEEIQSHIIKLGNERMERERDILREQEESHGLTSGRRQRYSGGEPAQRRISEGDEETEESEDEEEELWENHEHLLRHMENEQQDQQQQQQFHPLAVQSNFSNSEQSSIDKEEDKDGRVTPTGGRPQDERSHGSSFSNTGHAKQTFHPLSRNRHFEQSEQTLSTGGPPQDERSHNSSFSNTGHAKQTFHPLSRNRHFEQSEQTLSTTESFKKEVKEGAYNPISSSLNGEERGHKPSRLGVSEGTYNKQKFHPLSKMRQFESERSIDIFDINEDSHISPTPSVQSTDSDRIQRLCQGSRGSLMMEGEISRSSGIILDSEKSPIRDISPNDTGERRRNCASGGGRKRGSNNTQPKKGERSDSNRFSLKRLSSASGGSPQNSDGEEPVSRLSTSDRSGVRKVGQRRENNRFSLTRIDSKGRILDPNKQKQKRRGPRRSTLGDTSSGLPQPANLEMEMNASKNWNSLDVLRDAAAEANGDLDAAVDALFGSVPSHKNVPTDNRPKRSSGNKAYQDSPNSTTDDEDEDAMVEQVLENLTGSDIYHSLTGESTRDQDESIADTIRQRRLSVSSSEGGGLIRHSTIKDIPVIIKTVKSRPTDQKCTERAFQSLFLLATDPDPEGSIARKEILANDGMETLRSAIWDHMEHSKVLLALFHALWAISVFNSNDEENTEASIVKIKKCGVLDGLLFAMQSHADDLNIQESGCDLITRLTGLLPTDTPEFKPAVVMLSNNMQNIDANTKAYSSCLDALNSLCQLSDENKREFAKAGNDCHNAIIRGLSTTSGSGSSSDSSPNMETRELACQLFWCVTSDRTAVSVLSLADGTQLLKKIIDALKTGTPRSKSSVHFYGAACGTLANLALDPNNHAEMIDLGTVPILCDAVYVYDFSEDVISAVCTALANLTASRDIGKAIVSQGSVPALFSAMKGTPDNANVQGEAFRALHNLCDSSSEGKRAIAAELDIIVAAYFRHEGVKYIQQITVSIICRLSSEEVCRKRMVSSSSLYTALAKIMKANSRKKLVQKTACAALSNLSTEEEIIPILLSKGFDSLVIDAMDAYGECEELQQNACTFLMNMGSHSPEASVEICSGEGIHCIVKAMQTIPTSALLQQASCGALHAITKGDTHKSLAVSAGAVDAVIYLMLVHPMDTKVLENAVNVLTNLSSLKKCTKTIADAGGISTVIETMRSHPSSTGIIKGGSRFIRNMALSEREYANESLGGIAPILGCMDEHPNSAKLVEESCKALRCLVLKSESCKDQVITADGVAVIEKTMDENGAGQRWQTLLLDELFQ